MTIDHEQGTKEWLESRLGNVTASRIGDVMAKPGKKGSAESRSRANYRARLIVERLSGRAVEDEYQSYDMKRGIEIEPIARAEYEMRENVMVETAGFVMHPTIPRFGASVDGLVGKDGLVQFKCPKTAIHLEWLMAKRVPPEHVAQMLAELSCRPERKWSDFVSYEPNLPHHLQLFKVRMMRDETAITEMELEVVKFNAEIDEIISKLPAPDQKDRDLTEEWQKNVDYIKANRQKVSA